MVKKEDLMVIGLDIKVEKVGNKIILRVTGRLDVASSPFLEKKLHAVIEENNSNVLIDFSKIDYLSSAGLRLLISTTKQLKTKKGFLALFAISDEVFEIIKMAGLEHVLNIFSQERDALQFVPKKS
jgi:anti-sigma B factor antagonist/stage II sporulation protein AA (anti-sigma F factor antagonist)